LNDSQHPAAASERFRLDGATAIVTGASSGLGRRFAEVLSGAGANLVVTARREDRVKALAEELGNAIAVAGDITLAADREAIVAAAVGEFGAVDVLVNNAGLTKVQPALVEDAEFFEQVLRVNLAAPMELARLVAPGMLERGKGSIVNVASSAGLVGGQMPQAGYHASKGGVVNLTRELASQWGRKGVRVNALAPGWFPSEMTEVMFNDEKNVKWMADRTPMRRSGRDGELDGALLLLASDAGSFITGHTLVVDGGWTAV
jgi:NAD(P)-dependent dehydrogenase (short-subunit alcohol dehydrogenase family)